MTDEKKPLTIQFAPGAFDNFEGTQEELDTLIQEIQDMFTNMTPEEIAEASKPMSDEEFDDLPEDVKMQLIRSYYDEEDDDDDDDLADEFKRKLQ